MLHRKASGKLFKMDNVHLLLLGGFSNIVNLLYPYFSLALFSITLILFMWLWTRVLFFTQKMFLEGELHSRVALESLLGHKRRTEDAAVAFSVNLQPSV